MRLPGVLKVSGREWSLQQKAIFEAFRSAQGHVLVRARAGTGKTTTILEALQYAPENKILLAAFNKQIADELQTRVSDARVTAKTLHALGMGYIRAQVDSVRVDANNRAWDLVKECAGDAPQAIKIALKNLHTKVRELNPWAEQVSDVERIAIAYDLVPDEADLRGRWDEKTYYETVLSILENAADDVEVIDFADMIFLPLRRGWAWPVADLVVVDEAQDMTGPQLEIALRACRKDGRIVIVGDDRQCHPAGTKIVKTGGEIVPIEKVAIGDELVTYHDCFRGVRTQGRRVEKVVSYHYEGPLYSILTSTQAVSITPNHKVPTRVNAERGGYVVYVMESGNVSRIGTCRASYTNGFGLAARMKHECADRGWVLKWFKDKDAALVYETTTALRYGLPENIFFEKGHLREKLVAAIGDNRYQLGRCLAAHARHYDYPLITKGEAAHIGRYLYVTEACNLITDLNEVRTYDGTRDGGAWEIVTVATEPFQGEVYGLQVEPTEGGHRLYVADNILVHNSIYGFRGAASDGLDRLKTRLEAVELGLTTTYRCGKAIVEVAKVLVPDFEAAPTAPEGVVRTAPAAAWMQAQPGDFVLSRANAPLMGVALGLIRQGKRARIRGRDIGKGLVDLVNKLKLSRLEEIDGALERWSGREIGRLNKKDQAVARTRIAQIMDNVDTLNTLAETVASVAELQRKLETLFSDEGASESVVMCSTIHRAKGLEAGRVWVLEDTLKGGNLEEENLRYVAMTRAKEELVLVTKNYVAPEGEGDHG